MSNRNLAAFVLALVGFIFIIAGFAWILLELSLMPQGVLIASGAFSVAYAIIFHEIELP